MAEGRKAVLQVERRTWDTEEYQRRADERREEEERLEKEVRARSEHHFRACALRAPAGPRPPDGATGVLGAEGGCRCRKEADGRGHCSARSPQQGSVLTPESSAGSACRTLCPLSCLSLAPVLRFALCPSPTPSLSVYACWLASAPAHTPDKTGLHEGLELATTCRSTRWLDGRWLSRATLLWRSRAVSTVLCATVWSR